MGAGQDFRSDVLPAEQLRFDYLDTDDLIVAHTKRTIAKFLRRRRAGVPVRWRKTLSSKSLRANGRLSAPRAACR